MTMQSPTLQQWLNKFEALRAGEVSERTEQNYASTIDYLRDFLGAECSLRKITSADGDDFRVHLRKLGLSPPTVASHMIRAVTIFERAVVRGTLKKNPFTGLAPAVERSTKTWVPLLDYQVKILIDSATGDLKRLIGLCAYAGLRRGEAMRLLNRDVDLVGKKIHVIPDCDYETTKQRAREVLLVPELEALLDPKADPDTLVCPGVLKNPHRSMVGYTSRGAFYPGIIQRAGLKVFDDPFHSLRRWRATSWRAEFDEWIVDLMLGHGPEVARQHYVKIPEEVFARSAP